MKSKLKKIFTLSTEKKISVWKVVYIIKYNLQNQLGCCKVDAVDSFTAFSPLGLETSFLVCGLITVDKYKELLREMLDKERQGKKPI